MSDDKDLDERARIEAAEAALLWLRVGPPHRPPPMLKGPRGWEAP